MNGDRILVAGASGDTGREILRSLDGYADVRVRALTTVPAKRDDLLSIGADEVVVGDILYQDDAREAVDGVDVVLSAVGSTPQEILTEDEFVDGVGNINLARAAEHEGVRHIVMESAIGVGDEPTGVFGSSIDLFLRPVQEAKEDAEREIRSLDIDYTIIRPGALSPVRLAPSPQVADAGAGLWGGVSRRTVAELMTASPYTPEARERTLEVVENALQCRKDADISWRTPEEK